MLEQNRGFKLFSNNNVTIEFIDSIETKLIMIE